MGTSTTVNRAKHVTIKSHESLCIHSYKSTWLYIHKHITFGDNISNTFIKSNIDHNIDQNTSTTYILPYSKPSISYIAVIINPTDYVFNHTRFTHTFGIQNAVTLPPRPCLYSRALRLQTQDNKNTKT